MIGIINRCGDGIAACRGRSDGTRPISGSGTAAVTIGKPCDASGASRVGLGCAGVGEARGGREGDVGGSDDGRIIDGYCGCGHSRIKVHRVSGQECHLQCLNADW